MWVEKLCYWVDSLPRRIKSVMFSVLGNFFRFRNWVKSFPAPWKWIKRLPAPRPGRKPLPRSVRKLLSDLGCAVTVALLIVFVYGVWWCFFCLPFA